MKKFVFLSILILYGIPGSVFAGVPQDRTYRFMHNTITVRDLTVSFTAADFASAGADFSSAGNLSFLTGPSHLNPPYSGHVAFHELDAGPTNWLGLATTYNINDVPCVPSICTMAPGAGADYGYIRFNTNQLGTGNFSFDPALRAWLLRHEFGHILGMDHPLPGSCDGAPPSIPTVMHSGDCPPVISTLQAIDKSIINSWYP